MPHTGLCPAVQEPARPAQAAGRGPVPGIQAPNHYGEANLLLKKKKQAIKFSFY